MKNLCHIFKKIKNKIKNVFIDRWTHYVFYHKRFGTGLSRKVCKCERQKYLKIYEENKWKMPLRNQMFSFFTAKIKLVYDTLDIGDDFKEPILIVTEINELERMKVLVKHYRNVGVRKFIVIDNNSSDGTLDWLFTQNDMRVYRVFDDFETNKKVGWIQRVMAMTGYNRWYIVVDSDELLDYVGSEKHSVLECIEWAINNGYDRLGGLLIDMYIDAPMFSANVKDIEKSIWFFDGNDSYRKEYRDTENGTVTKTIFSGGPRKRVLGSTSKLGKQPVFYFTKDTLYYNCHFVMPIVEYDEAPCCFAIRHYKFLESDVKEYQNRVLNGNFAFGSKYYKDMFDDSGRQKSDNMIFDGSVKFENSDSFRCLDLIDVIFQEE